MATQRNSNCRTIAIVNSDSDPVSQNQLNSCKKRRKKSIFEHIKITIFNTVLFRWWENVDLQMKKYLNQLFETESQC